MYHYDRLIKSIIGSQVYEALNKAIVKLNAKSVVDITELHDALKIAPKSVVAFLMENLGDMEKDGAKEIPLPWDKNSSMLINKIDTDTFKGHISKDGKIEHEFDLCSIPQLSAHLLSHFELYNEVPEQKEDASAEIIIEERSASQDIKQQLKSLESKINALIMLSVKAPLEPIKKSKRESINSAIKSLKKAGLAPKMPSPPRAGVHAGSQQGIAQAGLHSMKTLSSDMNTKEHYDVKNPQLKSGNNLAAQHGLPKQPEAPKQAKMSFAMKSDNASSTCLDCGEPDFHNGKYVRCSCFKVMSKPEMKKSDNGVVTLSFQPDWDLDARLALWDSLKKVRK